MILGLCILNKGFFIMSEKEKQEIMLQFKKFYNAMPLMSKKRLKAIADKELNTDSETKVDHSFIHCFRKLNSGRD